MFKDNYEIRHRALLEAIQFCGGITAYSHRLNLSRRSVSHWRHQPDIMIPYEYLILTEDITQVSIERLAPFTEVVNKTLRRLHSLESMGIDLLMSERIAIGSRLEQLIDE